MIEDKPKFTPGPWRVVDTREEDCDTDYEVATEDGWLVAVLGNDHLDIEEANAALIAAAPEMYDELNGASVFMRTLAEVLEATYKHDSRREYAENVLRLAKGMAERADRIDTVLAKTRGEER